MVESHGTPCRAAELTLLTAGWASVRRPEAGALAVLVLRGPAPAQPSPPAAVRRP
ncbi:hypothetical protein J2S46_000569 [Kitasatospora herbaricolor]|nr:hypothetical protein [Kitasatospora herbaricolor]